MKSNNFFISGNVRSGTTLLDKLLCNHSEISVLSQALPSLFIATKQKFLKSIGVDNYYPLTHYNEELCYTLSDFLSFLNSEHLSSDIIYQSLNSGYSGQYTAVSSGFKKENMTFVEWYNFLVYENRHKQSANIFGDKEVLCEEYVPYFVENKTKVVHIIRNPMDVINSIYFGGGNKFIGSIKPILFNLHNWRKSAQLALQLSNHPNFLLVYYEDLVTNPHSTLNDIFSFLNAEAESNHILIQNIKDQAGKVWQSNSSFESADFVNIKAIGNYQKNLSSSLIQYINFICYPELSQLSYSVTSGDGVDVINKFTEPFAVNDKQINHNYSCNDKIKKIEIERLEKYLNGDYSMEFDCSSYLKYS